MDNYSQYTIPALQDAIHRFERVGQGLYESKWATKLLKNKLSGTPVRAMFVAQIAVWAESQQSLPVRARKLLPGYRHLFDNQLPFVFEVVIAIQYLHNQILDEKSGVKGRIPVSSNLLAANLLKEQLYDYIRKEIPFWARKQTEASVRSVFQQVDMGQYLEQEANTYAAFLSGNDHLDKLLPDSYRTAINLLPAAVFIDKLKAELPSMLHNQLEVYFHRIYLTCASLFIEAGRLVATLCGVGKNSVENIVDFSVCYGLMRQLVNDNADWVPGHFGLDTKTKTSADAFSDIRTGILTLSALFHLAENKQGVVTQILSNNIQWSDRFEPALFDEILHSNALYKSIQHTRVLAELSKTYLPVKAAGFSWLEASCEIAAWNKFLRPCVQHEAFRKYRQLAHYKRTRQLALKIRAWRALPSPVLDMPTKTSTVPNISAVAYAEDIIRKATLKGV
ncbi:MAG: hypothetical protein R2795_01925 [Saprospiraceae bacterium]